MFATTSFPLIVSALFAHFDVTVMIDTGNWPANPGANKTLTISLMTDKEHFNGGPLIITKDADANNARDAIFHVLEDSQWKVTRVAETRVILVPPKNAKFKGVRAEKHDWEPAIWIELKAKAKAK